jgi:DNA-binding NtrC family response regulator
MINKSPSASPLSLERGGGSVVPVPRECEALRRIKWQLERKAGDEVETVFLIEALERNKGNISKTAPDVKMSRRQLQNLI